MNDERYVKHTLQEVCSLGMEIQSARQRIASMAARRRFLLHLLIDRGISKTKLAKVIGVSRNTIYRILEGSDRDSS